MATVLSALDNGRTETPTDIQIRSQISRIRGLHFEEPLGFQRMLDAIKTAEPTWILGPVRLKKLLKVIGEEEAVDSKGKGTRNGTEVTPTDVQIRMQFYSIRSKHLRAPLGFEKMLDAIKAAEPTWSLGPLRLKKLLKVIADEEAAEENEREARGPYLTLNSGHSAALRKQIAWSEKSIRHYLIIGHDGYDYAVTPNSDMGLLLTMMQKRAVEEPAQRPHALYTMWEHLEPAAIKAGVPTENLRTQLKEEYGLDPLTAAPLVPRNAAERAARERQHEQRKANYKRNMMDMMRTMRRNGAPIPMDPKTRDVAWDDAKNGEFVVLVTRVDKATGLEELESW